MEKRKHPRIKTKLAAEFNNREALVENISLEGVKMKCWADAVPNQDDVNVSFTVGEQIINLEGVVRWCRKDRYSLQDLREFGVSLRNPPAEFYRFVELLDNQRVPAVML